MQYFDLFSSNSCAGSGNQFFFESESDNVRTGRIFYKITAGGSFGYSLLFSNIIDSTYGDGSISHKNLICNSWQIYGALIGKCSEIPSDKEISSLIMNDGENSDIRVGDFKEITFDGKKQKTVMPGEFFCSDPQIFDFKAGEYLCLEITFSGTMIPYHEETLLPVFLKGSDGWRYSKQMPFPAMIGCDRSVKAKIAFLGDSITQGLGTPPNSYAAWNAGFAEMLGSENCAFWNLGIGYGRADDAASDGAWLFKAKQNDIVFVCYGVNDILQGYPADKIKENLYEIVKKLRKCGVKVVLQTVPPFEYPPEKLCVWEEVNEYIRTSLCKTADLFFDIVPYLVSETDLHTPKFGGHPDICGCAVWAKALYEKTSDFIRDFTYKQGR